MIMPYIYIVIILSSFAIGGLSGYKVEHSNVLKLELAIANANAQSAAVMSYAKEKVAKATNEAELANKELDNAQTKFVETANAYDKQLDTIKLYANHKTRCPDPVSGGSVAGISKEAADYAGYAEELDRLVKEKSKIADMAAEYAMNAYKFATLGNCGIKP